MRDFHQFHYYCFSVCKIFLVGVIFCQIAIAQMKICEVRLDLMRNIIFDTERAIYEALKERPLEADITYAAIPWTGLIREAKRELRGRRNKGSVSQILINKLKDIYIPHSFTVFPQGNVETVIPAMRHIGIEYIFWPHAKENQKLHGMTLIPLLHLSSNSTEPAEHKDILYSFIGYNHARENLRKKIFRLPRRSDVIIKERKRYHSTSEQSVQQLSVAENEFKNVMSRSRFGLCPRGSHPASYRLWESLWAGAVPVILCDNLPLPRGVDWDKCLLRVKERDIYKLDNIIRAISAEQEMKMREEGQRVYCLLKEDPAFFIRHYFGECPAMAQEKNEEGNEKVS